MDPGPIDDTVLSRQSEHRSVDVWEGVAYAQKPLTSRMHLTQVGAPLDVDHRVIEYVRNSGFYGIHRLGSTFQLNMDLITALVERWRLETHTFHLPVGETTITLQDVAVLLGLRINGPAVTGTSKHNWDALAQNSFGVELPIGVRRGSSIKVTWLRDFVAEPLPKHVDDETIQCRARAYILLLMGAVMFADSSGGFVQMIYLPLLTNLEVASQYSWGGAVLAFLYRQLCRAIVRGKTEITGPLILVQLWAWERISVGRPQCTYYLIGDGRVARRNASRRARRRRDVIMSSEPPSFHDQFQIGVDSLAMRWVGYSFSYVNEPKNLKYYRDALDRLTDDKFIWQPYTPDILGVIAPICSADTHIWRTKAPLICFDIVEWHLIDRVLKQFGLIQHIPETPDCYLKLHNTDRRGNHNTDWSCHHSTFIHLWDERARSLVEGQPIGADTNFLSQYMSWYRRITRRLISRSTTVEQGHYRPMAPDLHNIGEFIYNVTDRGRQTLESVQKMHHQHQYDNMLSGVVGYCDYVFKQGTSLLNQIPFDQSHYQNQAAMDGQSSMQPPPSSS